VHRSDGSGTTYAFTDYLSKVSALWGSQVGVGKAVSWPTGVGAKGTAGVAQQVQQTPGSIGYAELAYALQANLAQAYIQNANGKFLQASADGATQAAAQATAISPSNFSITNEPGDSTYPIATFTWVILRKANPDAQKGRALLYVFKWVVTDGQQYGKNLNYAPLPSSVQQLALSTLKTVTAGGSTVLQEPRDAAPFCRPPDLAGGFSGRSRPRVGGGHEAEPRQHHHQDGVLVVVAVVVGQQAGLRERVHPGQGQEDQGQDETNSYHRPAPHAVTVAGRGR
jgi:hypothetical protein